VIRKSFVAIAIAIALASAPPAWGHAILVASAPSNGATVLRAPASVRITFNSGVKVNNGTAAIDNSTGASVLGGTPTVSGAGGITLVIPLRPGLGPGDYTVRWSIVSEIDGHEQQGVIAFAVGPGSAAPSAALTAKGYVNWRSVAIRTLFYLGVLAAVGGAFFGAVVLRPVAYERQLAVAESRLLLACFTLAFGGSVALLVTASTGGTDFSHAMILAAVVSGIGAVAAALVSRSPSARYLCWGAAAVLLVCPTLSGHALDPTQPRVLTPLVDIFHLGAAAIWLGGVVGVAATIRLVPSGSRALVLRRFSTLALVAVCVIAVTGISRALTEFTALGQVWSTSYGRALLVKSGFFVALIVAGWRTRTLLQGAIGRLRDSLLLELSLLVGVVAAVGALTDLPPGRDAGATPTAPKVPLVRRPPLPAPGLFTEAQQAGPYAVGFSLRRQQAEAIVIGPEGTAPFGIGVLIDGRRGTSCGAGCFAAPVRGKQVDVRVERWSLRFQVPRKLRPAGTLLRKLTGTFTSLQDLAIDQVLSSAPGLTQVTDYRERAPSSLAYVITNDTQRTAVGTAAIQIGRKRWDRTPGAGWVASRQTPARVPSPWWGPRSRNAYLVGVNEIAFFDPQIPAWFRLTFDPVDRRPLRLRMIAAAHFMTETYSDFDRPIRLEAP
jgi:copper transport protein